MFCKNCGKEILDEAVICVHCGTSTKNTTTQVATKADAPSTGMAVLSFFIPLLGLILWIVNKDTRPLYAKSAGKGALIGFIVNIVFTIIFYVIYFAAIIGSTAMYY